MCCCQESARGAPGLPPRALRPQHGRRRRGPGRGDAPPAPLGRGLRRARRRDAWGGVEDTGENICDRLAREGAVTTVVNGRDWAPACSVSNVNELMDDLADLGLVKTLLRSASGLSNETREIKAPEELDLPPGDILQMAPGELFCTALGWG
ncbi:unnamed protein product [Prorocentrum cordatum]|uniref:Uncharacterized protein n=1 Tax=Prorocentrum cordatum TaxID=2364126 RepID=A0ABN9U2T4_9DINO|nr:unnamed protein product [Polarella glacialis]